MATEITTVGAPNSSTPTHCPQKPGPSKKYPNDHHTITQLAEYLKISHKAAYGFLTFLREMKLVEHAKGARDPAKKGVGPDVYSFDLPTLAAKLAELVVCLQQEKK